MEQHLGYIKHAAKGKNTGNSRNGSYSKSIIKRGVHLAEEAVSLRKGLFLLLFSHLPDNFNKTSDGIIIFVLCRSKIANSLDSSVAIFSQASRYLRTTAEWVRPILVVKLFRRDMHDFRCFCKFKYITRNNTNNICCEKNKKESYLLWEK